jgi:adenylate cyclase class 2
MRYIEVEHKYQLPDPQALKSELKRIDAVPTTTSRQVDTYYNPPHRDFLAPPVVSEWLRLRETDHGASVNFKRWLPADAEIKTHCDEYETELADLEALRRTLDALDFTTIITVDKTREEWSVGENYLIAFDTVVDAGDFVEFEYKGDAASVEDAIASLEQFIDSLNVDLGPRIHRGYPHMLLGRDK